MTYQITQRSEDLMRLAQACVDQNTDPTPVWRMIDDALDNGASFEEVAGAIRLLVMKRKSGGQAAIRVLIRVRKHVVKPPHVHRVGDPVHYTHPHTAEGWHAGEIVEVGQGHSSGLVRVRDLGSGVDTFVCPGILVKPRNPGARLA